MRQDAEHDAVGIADEEAPDAPGLIDRAVDDLVPGPDRFGVRRVDFGARPQVDAHVRERGLHAGGPKTTCAWPEPKPM